MLLYNDYNKSKNIRHFSSDREIFLIYKTTNKRVSLGQWLGEIRASKNGEFTGM